MSKPNYRIPQPQRLRCIQGSFAWIDHRLIRNGYLAVMTHQEQSLYLFLALAADRNGVSFYRKEKICDLLGLELGEFEVARDRLIQLGLLAFAPYNAITVNGFYQLLSVQGQAPDFTKAIPLCAGNVTPATAQSSVVPARAQSSVLAPSPVADLAAQLANAFGTV